MFYGAKNGSIKIENTEIDYIVFGNGSKPFIMIPGLGEGLKTVKGTAIPFAMMYREVAKEYKVYCFSRRNILPQGFTTKDMAEDLYFCMRELGIKKAMVLGGRQDKIVGGKASEELAERIPGCELYMYEDYGHGLYEEAKDFVPRVLNFFGE